MWTEIVRKRFIETGSAELLSSIEAIHENLVSRRVEAIPFGDPNLISERDRALKNILIARQAMLHRAERLHHSCGSMVADENPYGLALLIRGQIEATAVLGFICDLLWCLEKRTIPFDAFHLRIASLVVGARHTFFSSAPKPTSILTVIEKADRHLKREGVSEKGILLDCYEWLSEYAHPNFISFSMGAKPLPDTSTFGIHHGLAMRDDELRLVDYLDISGMIFLMFYDGIDERLGLLGGR